MRRIGGDLTYSDLATHTSEWVDPVCVDYREVQLCELPPNGQGFAANALPQASNSKGFGGVASSSKGFSPFLRDIF